MSMDTDAGNQLVGTTVRTSLLCQMLGGAHISNNANEFSVDSSVVGIFNRKTNDGEIVSFRQARNARRLHLRIRLNSLIQRWSLISLGADAHKA
jgi:hypothetical protein